MIEQFAAFYVNVVEPIGRAMVVFFVILTVVWVLIVINDAKKGKELINNLFNFFWKGIAGTVMFVGVVLLETGKFILRAVQVVVAAIRDFFISRV